MTEASLREMFIRYPLGEHFRVIEAHDIARSGNSITTILLVEGQYGRDIRFYRWRRKPSGWKVDLARFSVKSWNWEGAAKTIERWRRDCDL
jgi:hypothetical protein